MTRLLRRASSTLRPRPMTFLPAAASRQLQHRRKIDVQAFWRIVVGTSLNIVPAGSQKRWMPCIGQCIGQCVGQSDRLGNAYVRRVGLNRGRSFRAGPPERVGGVPGCTHISKLVPAFAGTVTDTGRLHGEKPFQIDRCHALRSNGEAVRVHDLHWHQPPQPKTTDSPRSPE